MPRYKPKVCKPCTVPLEKSETHKTKWIFSVGSHFFSKGLHGACTPKSFSHSPVNVSQQEVIKNAAK